MAAKPTPFSLHVGDDVLADLKTRLTRVRWPDEVPDNHWQYGTDLPYLKSLVEYWRDGYDWRKHEAQLNSFEQYKVQLAGIDLHFIREEGKGPKPMPLLISHGWPGSVHEFHKIIPMLTDPARFGGDPADAFTVIAPSLPGYTYSFTPNQPRFSVEQIADVFAELMTDVLGFKRFAAQGGDWGGFVTSRLGYAYPERLAGIHINLLSLRRDTAPPENPTEEEKRYFEERAHWMKEEVGYTWIQGTKPQTLAYGLTDSPVGLAAWIVEKFHTWSDHRGDLDGYHRPRRDADQHHALLGDRCDRIFVLAVLRAHARTVADTRRRAHRRADGLRGVPEGDPASAALAGGKDVQRHPPLVEDAEGRAFCRARAAGTAGAGNPRVFQAAALKRSPPSAENVPGLGTAGSRPESAHRRSHRTRWRRPPRCPRARCT